MVKGTTDFSRRRGCSVLQDEVVTHSVWNLYFFFKFTDRAKARYYPALSQSVSSKSYEDHDELFCVQMVLLVNFRPGRRRRGHSKLVSKIRIKFSDNDRDDDQVSIASLLPFSEGFH